MQLACNQRHPASLLEAGGPVPQATLLPVVARRYSSTPLYFAAHSSETGTTEHTVLRAFNGPDCRDHSSTERRQCARSP